MAVTVSPNMAEFDRLFRAHYSFLCNVANKMLNDRHASEDIVQEVFAKLWAKGEGIVIQQSAKSYLFRMTVNATLDYLEKHKQTVHLQVIREDAALTENEDRYALKELEMKISEALDRLPPRCKAVFVLSRFEGMKYREIAQELGISVKTVENQMGKALELMREGLKPYLAKQVSSGTIISGLIVMQLVALLACAGTQGIKLFS